MPFTVSTSLFDAIFMVRKAAGKADLSAAEMACKGVIRSRLPPDARGVLYIYESKSDPLTLASNAFTSE